MKTKGNGFTLIELLAVIVILAVIALISTPIIIGVIEKARRGAFEDSAYGVVDAAKLYFTDKLADTNSFSKTEIDFSSDMKDFKLGGEKPYGGSLIIDSDGKQALAIYDKDHKWCAVKNFTEEKVRIIKNYTKCDKDVAENLVINGYGEYGDNTNFSKFTYEEDEKALSTTSSSSLTLASDQFISIDPNATYQISAEMKASDGTTLQYAGLVEYDIDKNRILTPWVSYIENTLTELTSDLKKGDTTVYLKDIHNWIQAPSMSLYPDLNKGFVFWNYKDSTGYLYPPETYSQNRYAPVFEYSNIHKDTNTITLSVPWDKENIKAGTKVSQTHSGSAYNYSLAAEKNFTTTYQKFESQITGYGGSQIVFTKFRHGTKMVKFNCLPNYSSKPNVTTTYKNIVLKKIN